MDFYLAPLRKYADFSGRARRKEYWTFALGNMIVFLVLFALAFIAQGGTAYDGDTRTLSPVTGLIYVVLCLFYLAILIPSLAVQVRRLHDTGRSGWWWFIQFVPAIGGIWFFVLTLLDSQPGNNQWGPSPKQESVVAVAS